MKSAGARSSVGRWWRRGALLGVAAIVVTQLIRLGREVVAITSAVSVGASRTRDETQERLFGPEFVRSIRRVRDTIPPNDLYFMIDGQTSEQGTSFFVNYRLAPRRAVLLGSFRKNSAGRLRKLVPDGKYWVVVTHDPGEPVELWRSVDLKEDLARDPSVRDQR